MFIGCATLLRKTTRIRIGTRTGHTRGNSISKGLVIHESKSNSQLKMMVSAFYSERSMKLCGIGFENHRIIRARHDEPNV
jgi:hypothetical protein